MSTHNIGFYEDLTKVIFQLSSNTHSISSYDVFIYKHIFLVYRGQNPVHVLGQFGKENAAAIFELFRECMPEYPISKTDAEGNTGRPDKMSLVARNPVFWVSNQVGRWLEA